MRIFITTWFIAAASIMPLTCAAQDASVPASDPPLYVDGSLCTKPDQIVFSCPLAKSGKIVSICAAGSAAPHRFYYAFGKPRAAAFIYPSKNGDEMSSIHATKQSYASSWSTVYSFTKQGYRYMVSATGGMAFIGEGGKQGLRSPHHGGALLVQKIGDNKAALEIDFVDNRAHYDNKLIQESSQELKPNPGLNNGLIK